MRNIVEQFAKTVISRELGCEVTIHDDGSSSGMYDLRVGSAAAPIIAIECVRAMDSVATETWNTGPANSPFPTKSNSGWIIGIERDANNKFIHQRIQPILSKIEKLNLPDFFPVDWILKKAYPKVFHDLSSLKITCIHRERNISSGNLYFSMEFGDGGFVNESGAGVVEWIENFTRSKMLEDVRRKLSASNAKEKHVFIPLAFGGANWETESFFLTDIHLNLRPPDLPEPFNAVWLICADKGLFWQNGEWRVFSAKDPIQIENEQYIR